MNDVPNDELIERVTQIILITSAERRGGGCYVCKGRHSDGLLIIIRI